jgi:purine-binding chemotaxis protein CheW
MDIAKIRKKAKDNAGGVGQSEDSSVSFSAQTAPVSPAQGAGTSPPLPVNTLPGPLPAVVPDATASSALDRLFAGGDGAHFASEESYQTALAAQGGEAESEVGQFLAFQLGSEEYALDINRISEIIKPREYTDIPRVPDYILGLVSLRGVVVPIFDLRQRFRMGVVELSASARVVVCREGAISAGLLVDKINQVVKIAADRIEPPPAVIAGIDRSLIAGVGRYQGRMIILLNLASVLEITSA